MKGKNSFQFSTGGLVKVEKRNGAIYQVAFTNGAERISQKMFISNANRELTSSKVINVHKAGHILDRIIKTNKMMHILKCDSNSKKLDINRPKCSS